MIWVSTLRSIQCLVTFDVSHVKGVWHVKFCSICQRFGPTRNFSREEGWLSTENCWLHVLAFSDVEQSAKLYGYITILWASETTLFYSRELFCAVLCMTVICKHIPVQAVLWRCWLGSRKGIRPVKKLSGEVLAWLSVWGEVQICIWPSWCPTNSVKALAKAVKSVLEKRPLNDVCFLGVI